jgi:hypothetical protein
MKRSRCEEMLLEIMRKVRELKPGGDLEGLLEDGAAELKQALYEEALAERQAVDDSQPESFSPSGLPALRGGGHDAPGGPSEASGADAGGGTAL